MKIKLAYGSGYLSINLPEERTTIINPFQVNGLVDEKSSIINALQDPIYSQPLLERVSSKTKICIAFTDITRATPNDRIIPWLLEYLGGPSDNITLINQLGTHRPNTKQELESLLTPDVVAQYRVLNHEPNNPNSLVKVGNTSDGTPAYLNRHLVEADLRIITGFIEPHFFAGFSGGVKGIMPGCAGLETIMSNHGSKNIGSNKATFGITKGNPLWEELRDIALKAGPSFLLNVTLNEQREITNVFAGDLIKAHEVGCEFVKKSAMQGVDQLFDIVVTTNSGYPLDQNLYQGVKGMSAGSRILKNGGTLILAAECREGIPSKSPLDKLLRSETSIEEVLKKISAPEFSQPEQWQAQIQALIQRKSDVFVHSMLDDKTISSCHLKPCKNISAEVAKQLNKFGNKAQVAVLPQGPLTIPFLN